MQTRMILAALALLGALSTASAADPLPSWNDGPSKQAILDFVAKVTKEGSPDFVPVAERIATFDNDGTLWSEQPMYFQVAFAFDRVKALADKHPEWKEKEPFKSVLAGDIKGAMKSGELGLLAIMTATHTNMTVDEFHESVSAWLKTARHPKFKRPYTDLVFQPMREVLVYLRANGFKTYIVSGGTVEFMRVFTEKLYGIPPEQVVGTTFKTKLDYRDGKPVIVRLPEIGHINDAAGKPLGIQNLIGRRPVMAFGNSDGDIQMLQWTTTGKGPRFGLLVHHTDADREFAYDRESHFGKLNKGLDEAPKAKWTVLDMKKDWKVIYPFEVPKKDDLANDPALFLKAARERLKWDDPAEPAKLFGPIHFVGTKGLSSFLIAGSEGHVLLYTGMPGSGELIEKSITKLGFNPKDVKLILTGHAHVDHVGGHAYLQKVSGAKIAMMREERELFESGGSADFHYGNVKDFVFDAAKVDTVFRDEDDIKLGDISITARWTPGHTKGSTTYLTKVVVDGKTYTVVFADGTGVNPGYRVVRNPSYKGIGDDYRRTFRTLESLTPDIWLTPHTDVYGYDEKLARSAIEGVNSWVDPEGYRKWVTMVRGRFEAAVEKEKAATK